MKRLLLIFALIGAIVSVSARETLSLKHCIAIGIDNNLSLKMAEGEVRAPRSFARHRRARKQSKTYENECSNNNLMPFGSGPTIPSGQR